MKYVFGVVELAVLILLAIFLFNWSVDQLRLADDVSNGFGFVGGLGGFAFLVYVAVKRSEFYTR